jgi:glutamyl-tRNA synthetase
MTKTKWNGKIMQPFRLSLVCAEGPHLFDIVEVIGKEETISRIESTENAPKIISFGHFH